MAIISMSEAMPCLAQKSSISCVSAIPPISDPASERRWKAAQAVTLHRAELHQLLAHPVQRQHRLLRLALNALTNRAGINRTW